ncbi:hypothetical protein SeMB42_g03525 [Synchytrium endobioticum]|uniref:Protein kinase domain-containing protein n=1 Tax=Synchytrium endobioticum TaxID=286115 RepID=A0A507D619_9FUNG|nr:hypothetical protein SeMB42_g03525 [Synchytrium endobioticum]
MVRELGDGSFGSVLLAINKDTNEKVAIKKMKQKYATWDECLELRELKSLKQLRNYPNIINLLEVFRDEQKYLHFVFEYMDSNLYQWLKARNGKLLSDMEAKRIAFQILMGMEHIHKNGYFHRDMKPENLLMKGDGVKIADFGLAREVRSRPPYTEYVSTRWYRAPEVLLRSTAYSSPIDIWAIGTIIAEVCTLKPLLPGNSEMDQIFKMCSLLGPPKAEDDPAVSVSTTDYLRLASPNKSATASNGVGGLIGFTSPVRREAIVGGGPWPEGIKLAASMAFKFPKTLPVPLANICPNMSTNALHLVASMLQYDPHRRPTAYQSLQSNWLSDLYQESVTLNVGGTERNKPTLNSNSSPEHLPRGNRRVAVDAAKPLDTQPVKPPAAEPSLPSVFQTSSPIRKTSAGTKRHGSATNIIKPTSRKSSPRHQVYPTVITRRKSGELSSDWDESSSHKKRGSRHGNLDIDAITTLQKQQTFGNAALPGISSSILQLQRRSPSPEYDIDKLIDDIDDAVGTSSSNDRPGKVSLLKQPYTVQNPYLPNAAQSQQYDFRNNSIIPPISQLITSPNLRSIGGSHTAYGLSNHGNRTLNTKKSVPGIHGSQSLGSSFNNLDDHHNDSNTSSHHNQNSGPYQHQNQHMSPQASILRKGTYPAVGLSLTVKGLREQPHSSKYTSSPPHNDLAIAGISSNVTETDFRSTVSCRVNVNSWE